jgi:hypothetical protein
MTGDDALQAACHHCTTAAALLAVADAIARDPTADTRAIARLLATGVVAGWADDETFGAADARGITVTDRRERVATRVSWTDVAVVVRRGVAAVGRHRIAAAYGRYIHAAIAGTGTGRLRWRASAAELAQLRRDVIALGLSASIGQPTLFDLPTSSARGRP